MAGNPIIEHFSMPQPQYAGEDCDIAGSRIKAQAAAVAALLHQGADFLYPPEHQEGSTAWSGARWEQVSLTIHRLRTNGVHYRLAKRLLDILTVCALLPYLVPLFLIVAATCLPWRPDLGGGSTNVSYKAG